MQIFTEIGMNHMGDDGYADQHLEALVDAHPDGITFQVQTPEYYAEESHRGLALTDAYYAYAAARVRSSGMCFGVSLCDIEKVEFFEEAGTSFYKILSKDIGNHELVAAVLATGKPVYVSTGMSDGGQIESFLAGFDSIPSNLSLIHTQLSYDDADTNLRAISSLRERFGVPVGFGSHSTDVNALYASIGFLPSALFFYVKGSRPITHRDEAHAIPLPQCAGVIATIRKIETMMGDGEKRKIGNTISRGK